MTATEEAVSRIRAWIRDYGDKVRPYFVADVETVLAALTWLPCPPPSPEAERTETDHAREAAKPEKTSWETACEWYREEEINRNVRQLYEHSPGELNPVPTDVFSQEFARWLTHQYRSAMSKGIQLGQGAATAEKDAEIARLTDLLDCCHHENCDLSAKVDGIPWLRAEVERLKAELDGERRLTHSYAADLSRADSEITALRNRNPAIAHPEND